MKHLLLSAVTAALMATTPLIAQEMKAETRNDLSYMRVEMYKFKPGTGMRRAEIEAKFMAAGKAAGTPEPTIIHNETGAWDAIYVFPLREGLKELEYRTSPTDAAFMNALAKSEGGMDKAKALRKEWNDTVENELDNIGHVHKPK